MGLDAVEVIMTIETKYGIKVPDDLPEIHTVQDLTDLVVRLIAEQKGSKPEPEAALKDVMKMIEEMSSKWCRKPITPTAKLPDILSL